MFDVGFTEIILIGIVALVVIGPERLPAVAKTAGQWIGKLQRFVRGVKTDLASELQSGDLKKLIGDQREQINELKNMVSSAKKDFENNSRDVMQSAKKSLGELETSVKELDGTASKTEKSLETLATDSVRAESDTVTLSKTPNSNDSSAGSTPVDTAVSIDASTSPQSLKPISSGTNGGQETSTMRTGSSGSTDDSDDMNRAGTESGS
ncbi:Sec-independent protein translocase protein TatB [Granulosicoccus antarcticus]|uniref:Sec-independent protein translocase protein TatB n=1 Tax=Granulosicoccus antarcticus IMCC3135 TaxID=1192854 RepID=A0A2Z2P4S9_9GAMM|nr:Sec-independent protein translocase protein TatB [Granulosicoccus antarcticus]ASJ76470.1 Sec-independent protein translocase protein TatB [Granulosicoccus antarcticus IMCC3135]